MGGTTKSNGIKDLMDKVGVSSSDKPKKRARYKVPDTFNLGNPKPTRDIAKKVDKLIFEYLVHRETISRFEISLDQELGEVPKHPDNWVEIMEEDQSNYSDKEKVDWFLRLRNSPAKEKRDAKAFDKWPMNILMQYRATLQRLLEIIGQFKKWGFNDADISSMDWNDCPPEFIKFQVLEEDYSLVLNHGQEYRFNGDAQRIIVKHLHEQTMYNKTCKAGFLLMITDSTCDKLRDLFDGGKHPAFNRLIIQEPAGSGNWKLNITVGWVDHYPTKR
tara:strand:- start:540 stop:1361 length:822 start_codon:yes stop_codon:yes gene_type:complete